MINQQKQEKCYSNTFLLNRHLTKEDDKEGMEVSILFDVGLDYNILKIASCLYEASVCRQAFLTQMIYLYVCIRPVYRFIECMVHI